MAEGSPFAAGAAVSPAPPAPPFANFGNYFHAAFRVYGQRWRDWIVPMLVAAAVFLAAMCCCYLPILLVPGPLACGSYACALATLRNRPFDSGTLWRGWPATWSAVAAYWATMLLAILPTLLFYIPMILFSVLASHGGGPHHAGPAEPWRVALLLGSFALMMVGWFLAMAWIFFLQTRTMFILPLIADRGLGFFDAWRTSWQETRRGFWELLLLQFLAGLIGALGVYFCYVGLLCTMPISFTIIAAVYEERLGSGKQ
ncbi:MAG: glycerophosphoryl diester phosphodiesterase membrane domain-containing protein [Thermoguttaceae bacterium]